MLDILLNVYETKYLSIATYGVALAFTLLAAFAPTRGALLRPQESASPLWLLVPVLVVAGLLSVGRGDLLVVTVGANTLPTMFLIQVVVSLWVLWRNRGFPWLVVLAALASGWIQWSFFLAAQRAGTG